jgi:hypothetical protein
MEKWRVVTWIHVLSLPHSTADDIACMDASVLPTRMAQEPQL